jgi:glycosyltransferase involved in cell wall biosynthesis
LINKNSIISFLLIPPNTEYYYLKMLDNLADALIKNGHRAYVIKNNVNCDFVNQFMRRIEVDVVIQINELLNPNLDLPNNSVFISWYQDIFSGDESYINKNISNSNFVITLGCPEILGLTKETKNHLGTFYPGVSESTLKWYSYETPYDLDVSFCGFIPKFDYQKKSGLLTLRNMRSIPYPANTLLKTIFNGSPLDQSYFFGQMSELVLENYTPLTGSLDVSHLEKTIRDRLGIDFSYTSYNDRKKSEKSLFRNPNLNIFNAVKNIESFLQERAINFFTQTFPRFLDRERLFFFAESLTESFKFYGKNWDKYDYFKGHWGGVINSTAILYSTYKKSKINLANNTHGLGIHTRVLEAMACGGFIAMHNSKRDMLDGGILSSFEEGEHFVYFNKDNLSELIKDDINRKRITKNAFENVRDNHSWDNRAKQLLGLLTDKLLIK